MPRKPARKRSAPGRRRRARLVYATLVALAATAGSLGAWIALTWGQLPAVTGLESYRESVITDVMAADGTPVGAFAVEWRIRVPYGAISPHFIDALVAVEDSRFFRHPGIDLVGLTRAMLKNVAARRGVEGASTITQQLARLLFLSQERTLSRKAREALLALQIEKHYGKQQILEFYANKIYMHHGVYGVEAAARYYFDKSAADLDVPEAALLAGLHNNPGRFAPDLHPEAARGRRNHVLRRMAAEQLLSAAEAEELQKAPILLRPGLRRGTLGLHFVEEVRKHVLDRHGADRLYRAGLRVHTTMDVGLQRAAERALRRGLVRLDREGGWRGGLPRLPLPGGRAPLPEELAAFRHPDWKRDLAAGDHCHALVTSVSRDEAEVRIGRFASRIRREGCGWLGPRAGAADLRKALRPGDLPTVLIEKMPAGDAGDGLVVELAQEPEVEGAVVALEVGTGQVKALVGGWDFDRSKFDRATQALRQVGSAFKPFVYAAAIDNGYGQNDLLEDVPLELRDPRTGRVYAPQNYDHAFLGPIPMWKALAQSRNVPAVRMLMSLGAPMVVDYARLCGITSKLAPYPSLALGAAEVTPLEMARAYSVFANRGVLVEPSFLRRVVDQDGQVVEEARARPRPVLSAATAAVMTDLLGEVIRSGTATKARRLGRALAGKTGTTNDYTDAWFVGYSPTLVVAVWVGHDERRSLGRQRTGGKVALPIWMDVMAAHLETHPAAAWPETAGVVWVKVDRISGLRAGPDCPQAQVALQAFRRDRQPDATCTADDHAPSYDADPTDAEAESLAPADTGSPREEHRLPRAPLVVP